jgi:D-beta-D-heptose 7-phosphate kinase/D-beta-D-heptose 1-phosphate adenosyltransferase
MPSASPKFYRGSKKPNKRYTVGLVSRVVPPSQKVLPLPALLSRLVSHRARGERLVLTNGCFDLLHLGHVRYLQEAAELGDLLIVALNSDASVGELKEPGRPLVPEQQRAEVLAGLGCVDYVTIFEEPTAQRLVEAIRPSVYVKGGDYAGHPPPEAAVARAVGAEVRLLSLVPGLSTTDLIRRVQALPNER